MCGVAGPRETILDVPQQVAGEMRRPAHRSSHVHNMPAEGNGTITGSNRLFLSRWYLKTEPSGSGTHMSIRSGSSWVPFSTYSRVMPGDCAHRAVTVIRANRR